MDLATLGTLADYMPLLGQNRSLVAEGIKMINEAPRPAIRAILDVKIVFLLITLLKILVVLFILPEN